MTALLNSPLPYMLVVLGLYIFSVWADAQTSYRASKQGYTELNPLIGLRPTSGLMIKFFYIIPVVALASAYEYYQIARFNPEISGLLIVYHENMLAKIASFVVHLALLLACVKIIAAANNLLLVKSGISLSVLADVIYRSDKRSIHFLITSLLSLFFVLPLFWVVRKYLIDYMIH